MNHPSPNTMLLSWLYTSKPERPVRVKMVGAQLCPTLKYRVHPCCFKGVFFSQKWKFEFLLGNGGTTSGFGI